MCLAHLEGIGDSSLCSLAASVVAQREVGKLCTAIGIALDIEAQMYGLAGKFAEVDVKAGILTVLV